MLEQLTFVIGATLVHILSLANQCPNTFSIMLDTCLFCSICFVHNTFHSWSSDKLKQPSCILTEPFFIYCNCLRISVNYPHVN